MKVKVIKKFIDKYTQVLCEQNSIIEVTKERLQEINATPLGIFVEEIVEKKETKKKKDK